MHGPVALRSGKVECDSLRVYRGKGEGNTQVGKYRVRGEPGEGLLRPLVARIRPPKWAGQPPLGNGLVSPGLVSPKFLRGRASCDLGSYSKQRPRV